MRKQYGAGLGALLLIAGLVAMPVTAEDTYYRWKDERGNIVLSDRPPPLGTEYETVVSRERSMRPSWPPESAMAPAAPPTPAPGAAGVAVDSIVATPVQVARDPAACAQARTNLEALNTKPRIRVYDPSGELRYLTPEEIEEEKRKSRLTIEVHCEK